MRLPDEIVVSILRYLEPTEIVAFQHVCRRYLVLGRDLELWKHACFEHTRVEAQRRRQESLQVPETSLSALTHAVNDLSFGSPFTRTDDTCEAKPLSQQTARARALASWDPSRPNDRIDFYQEYIQRYGPVTIDWLQPARVGTSQNRPLEALGLALFQDEMSIARRAVCPLEDGSIAIWELSPDAKASSRGRILDRSRPGILMSTQMSEGQPAEFPFAFKDTGAVESISIDSSLCRAYVAIGDTLNEIDLNTFQVVRRQPFPFQITTLSAACVAAPLTVGTAMTLHLYDTRDNRQSATMSSLSHPVAGSEQISGPLSVSASHALLTQPGPLSILHQRHDIWVAGRFTSLLCYDRRSWPQIRRTLFSGARLSSLTALPFAYIPPEMDLMRSPKVSLGEWYAAKSAPGSTIVAAGEYRGKGSIELYGLSQETLPQRAGPSFAEGFYHNRQTASKSRLLSVAAHGARLVFTDGDGGIKWVERDGCSLVRSLNINDKTYADAHKTPANESVSTDSGYSSSATEATAAPALFRESEDGDIVQKILPMKGYEADSHYSNHVANRDDLLLWTGDGRVGQIGFHRSSAFEDAANGEGPGTNETCEKERLYEMRMRRALERAADETRYVQGLGLTGLSM